MRINHLLANGGRAAANQFVVINDNVATMDGWECFLISATLYINTCRSITAWFTRRTIAQEMSYLKSARAATGLHSKAKPTNYY